ncbi:MAG: DUF3570 domain-containing protein [Bacteroidia bacterium]
MGLLLAAGPLEAQTQPDTLRRPVEVDFLLHYYEQEGVHSAVTGGLGTEQLDDRGGTLRVYAPLDSTQALAATAAFNHYTSASTDRIDSYLSSASRKDGHAALSLVYEQGYRQRRSWYLGGSGAIESDYLSAALAGGYIWVSGDANRRFSLDGELFFDTWIVIFPEELRAPGLASVPTDKRRTLDVQATLWQIVNPRLQLALSADLSVQHGLLSTPFHRVYMQGEPVARIERLPGWRIKYPLSLRLHYFVWDWLVLRGYYRWYHDSFGISAHTLSLETPVKLGTFFSVYPLYRLHVQQASRYFAPYAMHDPDARFYTSDYDMSGFVSHKYGLGLSLAPLYGLARFRLGPRHAGLWRNIDLRGTRYLRSDGLSAWNVSLQTGLRL